MSPLEQFTQLLTRAPAISAKDWARATDNLNALPSSYRDVASLQVQVRNGESLYWYEATYCGLVDRRGWAASVRVYPRQPPVVLDDARRGLGTLVAADDEAVHMGALWKAICLGPAAPRTRRPQAASLGG